MLVYMRSDILASKERCKLPRDLSEVVEEDNKRLDEKLKLNKRAVAETEKRIKERKKQYAEIFLDPANPPYAQEGEESFLISKEWLQKWINGEPADVTSNLLTSNSTSESRNHTLVDLVNDTTTSSPKTQKKVETIELLDSPPPRSSDMSTAQSWDIHGRTQPATMATSAESTDTSAKPDGGNKDLDLREVKRTLQDVIEAVDAPDEMEVDSVEQSSKPSKPKQEPDGHRNNALEAVKHPSRVNPSRHAKDSYKNEKAIMVRAQLLQIAVPNDLCIRRSSKKTESACGRSRAA